MDTDASDKAIGAVLSQVQDGKERFNNLVGKVLRWLELGGEPQREELLLADPAVKYFWRFKENLAIRGGVLKYKWMSRIDR